MSQTITDTARYSFHVTWSPEDAEFIATCVEFPSLSWLAGTPEKALTGLRIVVDEIVDDMRANDEPVPEPRPPGTTPGSSNSDLARTCIDDS